MQVPLVRGFVVSGGRVRVEGRRPNEARQHHDRIDGPLTAQSREYGDTLGLFVGL